MSGLRQFLATKSPLKMMKNVFCISPQKLLSFSRYLSFCLDFLVMYRNGLIKKIRLILNLMTLQPRSQTILIHIPPNISRSKGNQTMKFGQLIKHKSKLLDEIKNILRRNKKHFSSFLKGFQ